MITSLNVLDNATLWVAISFVIFVFLVFKPLKNMMLTSLDKKIAELKHQLEESKKLNFSSAKNKFDDTNIVIITDPFKDSLQELVVTALNNLNAIVGVKTIRIEL